MSHECPADDCGETVKGVLMCRKHWRMVPRVMRTEVNGAWRAFQRASRRDEAEAAAGRRGIGRAEVWRDYAVARQAAVNFVNGRLAKA